MTSPCTSEPETPNSFRMWPIDYILKSSYSPLHLERQLPERQWRDAFEDLLALESNGEMISLESRNQEKEMGVKILYGKASDIIYDMNRSIRHYARVRKRILESREEAMLEGDIRKLSWIDDKFLQGFRSFADKTIKLSKAITKEVEIRKHFPASRLKQRGQWIASLISSGVLPGWSSRLEGDPGAGKQRVLMRKLADPLVQSDVQGCIAFTENELKKRFGEAESSARKIPSAGADSRPSGLRSDVVTINEDYESEGSSKTSPLLQYLTAQTTTCERVLLPDGSTVNRVILTNHSGDGKEERVEIIQDAGKVLEEVEKARMLMIGDKIDALVN